MRTFILLVIFLTLFYFLYTNKARPMFNFNVSEEAAEEKLEKGKEKEKEKGKEKAEQGFSKEELKDLLIGDWELIEVMDFANNKKYRPDKAIYFAFSANGSMLLTDLYNRKRSRWFWTFDDEDRLLIEARYAKEWMTGEISFINKGDEVNEHYNMVYTLSRWKTIKLDGALKTVKIGNYIWTLE